VLGTRTDSRTSEFSYQRIDAPLPVAGAQTMLSWTHCGIGIRQVGNQSWWTAVIFRNPN